MSTEKLAQLRHAIRQNHHVDEETCVNHMLRQAPFGYEARNRIQANAARWVETCRAEPGKQGLLDAFLQEYSLSTQEGVTLMCLAEALLRVPDQHTADRLIAEKIRGGEWFSHRGRSEKLFVNAATWGLVLTGKIVRLDNSITENPSHWLRELVGRIGEPAVRFGVLQSMKLMGQQYVLGRTIEEAIKRGLKDNAKGTRFSFDMLGEGARTYHDASNYFEAYMTAIKEIGQRNTRDNVYDADGISVKLSALHPRYHYSQRQLVLDEMLPRVLELAAAAKKYNIGFTIDAEEANRLDLSLDIFQALAESPLLAGWDGLGLVLQAYQKRALPVIDWLAELAATNDRRLMVRLVKGAYWDAEIKHAQELGLPDYPVFTRKVHSDLSYQLCASRLLAQREYIYPQFATHNAYTVAMLLELLDGDSSGMEFQRLHGMGELLHGELAEEFGCQLPLRVYAPVGTHRDLLPYLVRRLLENGANSSFVNQFLNKEVPANDVVRSPEEEIARLPGFRHSKIPLPRDIYRVAGDLRDNARGIDLDDPLEVRTIEQGVAEARQTEWYAGPIIGGTLNCNGQGKPQSSPADLSLTVGLCESATPEAIDRALTLAEEAQPKWQNLEVEQRAVILERAGDELERQTEKLTGLISLEAGRTLNDGISEVREAVDFCRYYANQIRALATQNNEKLLQGRGVFVCISPWNFPLAIFTGQVTAALAAGNAVIAKPAEQTPLVAAAAVQILHQAGIPGDLLHLLTGKGSKIGPQLMSDHRVAGVAFTGSTETAMRIQADLVKRGGVMPPLIAETGGQNAMLVDSTALPEQVVDDVINSAFLSAGQRCSALRVLFLQEDVADSITTMLKGALKALRVGEPWKLSSDLGPVIDAGARSELLEHIARMDQEATFIGKADLPRNVPEGHYIAPHIYQLHSISQLKREVFGPVLHIVRYQARDLEKVIKDINDTGYGLTLGIHSRIQGFAEEVFAKTRVGNTYINRNMVGAVVGVNPFGGQGLSGTGFKAGGPHYLLRFTNLWPSAAIKGDGAPTNGQLGSSIKERLQDAEAAQWRWNRLGGAQRADILDKALASVTPELASLFNDKITAHCQAMLNEARTRFNVDMPLPGPTGEVNTLSLHGRGIFLVYLDPAEPAAAIQQTIAALAAGNAVMIASAEQQIAIGIVKWLNKALPEKLLDTICDGNTINALLLHDKLAGVAARNSESITVQLSRRPGAIIPLVTHLNGPFTLLPYGVEKTYTNNVVATGGNALLLNLQE